MKDWLSKLLKQKEEKRDKLVNKSNKSESVDELRSINVELESINAEIAELRAKLNELEEEERSQGTGDVNGEQRQQPLGTTQILGTYGVGQGPEQRDSSNDGLDSMEYRSAFMNYVLKGERSQALEFRADAKTKTGDIGAVIPNTVMKKIIEKMVDYGRIFARVTKTNIQGGVEIPVASAKPTATWTAEGSVADKQKKEVTGKVSFNYYKLQIRVAVTLEADTVSMSIFEQNITDNIYEAMVVAIEEAIINGTGTGQPLGITKDTRIEDKQKVDITTASICKYQTWTTVFGKVPRKYRNGIVLIMNDSDWSKYIEGMVDSSGQPIARVTYGLNGTIDERLLGKEVIVVEDYLPSIDDADVGDIVGIIIKLSDYMLNSNLQMMFKRYFDEDTDEWINKSTMIADGKLGDKNGVILLKKAAVAKGK